MLGNATQQSFLFHLQPADSFVKRRGTLVRWAGNTQVKRLCFLFKRESWNPADVKRPLEHESTGDAAQSPADNIYFPPWALFLAAPEWKRLRGSPLTQLQVATTDTGDGPWALGPCGERKCNHTRSRWDWEIHIWAPECVWRTETLLVFIT